MRIEIVKNTQYVWFGFLRSVLVRGVRVPCRVRRLRRILGADSDESMEAFTVPYMSAWQALRRST